MPPRHAYWTILIGTAATSFRAHDRAELLPTFERLRARHPDAELKWFARGRLWSSPEEARAREARPAPPRERGRDWRPGGDHRDPRDRFRGKPGGGRRPKGPGAGARPPGGQGSRPPGKGGKPWGAPPGRPDMQNRTPSRRPWDRPDPRRQDPRGRSQPHDAREPKGHPRDARGPTSGPHSTGRPGFRPAKPHGAPGSKPQGAGVKRPDRRGGSPTSRPGFPPRHEDPTKPGDRERDPRAPREVAGRRDLGRRTRRPRR